MEFRKLFLERLLGVELMLWLVTGKQRGGIRITLNRQLRSWMGRRIRLGCLLSSTDLEVHQILKIERKATNNLLEALKSEMIIPRSPSPNREKARLGQSNGNSGLSPEERIAQLEVSFSISS